jgi:AcrR family transcriptional regulator
MHVNTQKQYAKSEVTKRSLCEVAIELINKNGYNNVKVKDITDMAGVAKGSFYYYFETKDNLIRYLFNIADEIYEKYYQISLYEAKFSEALVKFIFLSYQEIEKFGKEAIKAVLLIGIANDDLPIKDDRVFFQYLKDMFFFFNSSSSIEHFQSFVHLLQASLVGCECCWCASESTESLSNIVSKNIKILMEGYIHSK